MCILVRQSPVLFCLLAFLASGPAVVASEGSEPTPETPKFKVHLVPTSLGPDTSWVPESVGSIKKKDFPVTNVAVTGLRLWLHTLFTGYQQNEYDGVRISYSVLITGPDGKILQRRESLQGFETKNTIPADQYLPAQEMVELVIEGDWTGEYSIIVKARDHIAAKTATAVQKINIMADPVEQSSINTVDAEDVH